MKKNKFKKIIIISSILIFILNCFFLSGCKTVNLEEKEAELNNKYEAKF